MENNPVLKIANDLVSLCREEKYEEVYDKYFTQETKSVEPFSIDGNDPVCVGVGAIIEKGKKWEENVETIGLEISDPSLPNENQFIVKMTIETKNRHTGETKKESEYVLYTVEGEHISEERFFYCI